MKILISAIGLCFFVIGCEPQTTQQHSPQPQSKEDVTIKCCVCGMGPAVETAYIKVDDAAVGRTLQIGFLPKVDDSSAQLTICTKCNARGKIWKFIPSAQSGPRDDNIVPVGQEYFYKAEADDLAARISSKSMIAVAKYYDVKTNDFKFIRKKYFNETPNTDKPTGQRYETTFLLKNIPRKENLSSFLTFVQVDVKTGAVDETKKLVIEIIAPGNFRTL